MVLRMGQRRLRLLLERKLTEAVNGIDLRPPFPQNSQLSRVQMVIRNARQTSNLNGLIPHLDSLKGARRQFERCRIGTVPMLNWLRERANLLDVEVQLLGNLPLPSIAGETATITEVLKAEYTARLIDGVMRKARELNPGKPNPQEAI